MLQSRFEFSWDLQHRIGDGHLNTHLVCLTFPPASRYGIDGMTEATGSDVRLDKFLRLQFEFSWDLQNRIGDGYPNTRLVFPTLPPASRYGIDGMAIATGGDARLDRFLRLQLLVS